jgi:hypothetical protein
VPVAAHLPTVEDVYATQLSWPIWAPPPAVHRALLDPDAITRWRAPAGMRAQVHTFEGREGGTFQISLIRDQPTATTVIVTHDDIPDAIPAAEAETATRMALAKLAGLVEKDQSPR